MIRAFMLLACLLAVGTEAQSQESGGTNIGYQSVQDALKALQQKPGVLMTTRGGWTLFNDKAAQTMWSFAPADNPAYPAVAKTTLSVKDGHAWLDLRIKCEASKEQCDAFAKDMKARTQRATARTKEQLGGPKQ